MASNDHKRRHLMERVRAAKDHPDRNLLPLEQRILLGGRVRLTESDLKLIEGWYNYLKTDANRQRLVLIRQIEKHGQYWTLAQALKRHVEDRTLDLKAAKNVMSHLVRITPAVGNPTRGSLTALVDKFGPDAKHGGRPRKPSERAKPVPVMDRAMAGKAGTLSNVTPEERRQIMAAAGNSPSRVRIERGGAVPGTKKRKKRK